MTRSTYVYVSYIRTTPEKLWSALTNAEFMKQYWFGVVKASGRRDRRGSSFRRRARCSMPARSSRPRLRGGW
jgi:uncharacterized protein YndB with AHSA1/START domain